MCLSFLCKLNYGVNTHFGLYEQLKILCNVGTHGMYKQLGTIL